MFARFVGNFPVNAFGGADEAEEAYFRFNLIPVFNISSTKGLFDCNFFGVSHYSYWGSNYRGITATLVAIIIKQNLRPRFVSDLRGVGRRAIIAMQNHLCNGLHKIAFKTSFRIPSRGYCQR